MDDAPLGRKVGYSMAQVPICRLPIRGCRSDPLSGAPRGARVTPNTGGLGPACGASSMC
jgi:hypothetical protein